MNEVSEKTEVTFSPDFKSTEIKGVEVKKKKVSFVCPVDPAELSQCDSCQ